MLLNFDGAVLHTPEIQVIVIYFAMLVFLIEREKGGIFEMYVDKLATGFENGGGWDK